MIFWDHFSILLVRRTDEAKIARVRSLQCSEWMWPGPGVYHVGDHFLIGSGNSIHSPSLDFLPKSFSLQLMSRLSLFNLETLIMTFYT